MPDRLRALEDMASDRPQDPRLRFGLALEYLALERYRDAVRELRAYLDLAEDEGNAWGRLAGALRELGREEEAKEAYRTGMKVAIRHGHPSLAEEFESVLDGWD